MQTITIFAQFTPLWYIIPKIDISIVINHNKFY